MEQGPEANPLRALAGLSPSLKNLLVSDILIRFCEQIPYAFVVLWAVKTIAAPVSPFQFGLLTAVEMATAFLIYIPVAHFADKGAKKPFVLATFVFFTLFPLVLLFSRSFWPLLGAFVLRGLKEFGEPTRKALIMGPGPGGAEGGHLWGLLPGPGRGRLPGRVRRGLSVDGLAPGQLPGRLRLRRGRNALVRLEGAGSGIRRNGGLIFLDKIGQGSNAIKQKNHFI